MLFGTRSEKLRRQVDEAEALLKQQEQDSDRYNEREVDPQVPRQLRQSHHRHPLPEHQYTLPLFFRQNLWASPGKAGGYQPESIIFYGKDC